MKYIPGKKASALLGIHQNTLRKYADRRIIPSFKTASGQRRCDVDAYLNQQPDIQTVCYCRVSSNKQKDDLQRQVLSMQEQFPHAAIITDIAGGLNWQRKGLVSMLERLHQGDKLQIVVAHRDRLARFGFELIQWLVERNGGAVLVLNQQDASPGSELTEDIPAILHTFSCRLHGLRRYRSAIEKDPGLSQQGTEENRQTLV